MPLPKAQCACAVATDARSPANHRNAKGTARCPSKSIGTGHSAPATLVLLALLVELGLRDAH